MSDEPSDMKVLIRLMMEQQAKLNALAMAIEKQNGSRPFFTDLKIFAGITLILYGIVVWLVQSSFEDLKSVVMKVPVIEQRLDQHDRRIDNLERRP